jgi:hypothetical protein
MHWAVSLAVLVLFLVTTAALGRDLWRQAGPESDDRDPPTNRTPVRPVARGDDRWTWRDDVEVARLLSRGDHRSDGS